MKINQGRSGFSLLELLIVIAIIAFLSAISLPSFFKFLAKSKRAEAHMVLRSIYMAEKAYWVEHNKYTTALTGQDSLAWQPEGVLQYTYGFPGAEAANFVTGALKAPGSALQGATASDTGFVACAAADIDGDGKMDLLCIDQTGKITVVQDDLQ